VSTPGWGPSDAGPGGAGLGAGATPVAMTCYRHPERATGLRCTRCGRPTCPECLREAAVGFHCVTCLAQGQRDVRSASTVAGARLIPGAPLLTYGLIGLNVLMYLLTAVLAGSATDNAASTFFQSYGLFPYGVADGQLLRLVVSGFLQYGPLHLLLNMYALYILGREMETVLGRVRFAALYALALLSGSAAVMAFQSPTSLTVGASGAVFGLMGGFAVVLFRLRRSPGPILTIIALNVALSVLVPGISLWGHLGGLAAGALATAVLVYAPPRRRVPVQVGGLLTLTLLAVAVTALRVAALRPALGL
jgi:membrane associated rhomboid family serine protease